MKINRPKKKFGQNFLQDKNILKKIANCVDINNKNIIEIGPGKGALTYFLIEKAKKIIAYEIDSDLTNYLKENFKDVKNLKIINENFLDTDLSAYKNFYIISNIPYNISTDIIFKILENYENFETVVLLVQKEFAQRICASVNTKHYSKLTVSLKLFYDSEYCFEVLPQAFSPSPKVISALICLKKKENKIDIDKKLFLEFIKQCFSMKRKTLLNNLKSKFDKETLINCLKKLNLDLSIRPEKIEFEKYVLLFKNLNK